MHTLMVLIELPSGTCVDPVDLRKTDHSFAVKTDVAHSAERNRLIRFGEGGSNPHTAANAPLVKWYNFSFVRRNQLFDSVVGLQ